MATISNPNNRPIVTAETAVDTGVSVAIDYTSYYERIATALETMATNSTAIKNSIAAIETDIDTIATNTTTIATKQTIIADKQTIIADKQTIIAEKQTAMETYQKRLKELGEGSGIHVVSPYDTFGIATLWRLLILEGKILEDYATDTSVSASEQQRALEYLTDLCATIRLQIPKDF